MYTVQPFPFCDEEEARMEPITVLGRSRQVIGSRCFRTACNKRSGSLVSLFRTASAHLVV